MIRFVVTSSSCETSQHRSHLIHSLGMRGGVRLAWFTRLGICIALYFTVKHLFRWNRQAIPPDSLSPTHLPLRAPVQRSTTAFSCSWCFLLNKSFWTGMILLALLVLMYICRIGHPMTILRRYILHNLYTEYANTLPPVSKPTSLRHKQKNIRASFTFSSGITLRTNTNNSRKQKHVDILVDSNTRNLHIVARYSYFPRITKYGCFQRIACVLGTSLQAQEHSKKTHPCETHLAKAEAQGSVCWCWGPRIRLSLQTTGKVRSLVDQRRTQGNPSKQPTARQAVQDASSTWDCQR